MTNVDNKTKKNLKNEQKECSEFIGKQDTKYNQSEKISINCGK